MIRISFLPARLCAGPRRWLLVGLLGTLMACAGVPAWANADDGYTDRLVTEFAPWVGSPQDTAALVQSLQSGQALGPGAASAGVPATGGLGYGETRLALKLAQATLVQEGVTQPSGAQIQAALHGGTLDTANGPKTLAGVLPQRAQGVSWGAMAQSAGLSVEDLIPPKSAAPKKVARKPAKTKKASGKPAAKAGSKPKAKQAASPRKATPKKTAK